MYNACALSINCGEFYDDETISKVWGYVYYSCNGTVITDTDNNQTLELFGWHLYGRNSSYTERFALNHQNLTSFPAKFDRFFKFLRIIDFSFNNIESVTNSHLRPYRRLNSLKLGHNKISTLDSNVFDGLNQLIEVRLNDNDLKHVGYDIKLPRYVYVDNNPCTTYTTNYNGLSIRQLLRNYCPPLQSTIGQSVSSTHDVETESIVDHTQEREEAPATEEPSIRTKAASLGEVVHCSMTVMNRPNEPLGRRCTEILIEINSGRISNR